VSLFETLGEWMSQPAYFAAYGGTPPRRSGAYHPSIAPYGPYETGDTRQVFIGVQNEREWVRLCEIVLEQPNLASDPRFDSNSRRVANRDALDSIIRSCWCELTAEEAVARLEKAQIAYARLNSVQEYWDHPQLVERDRWREIDSPVGRLRATLPPITIQGIEPRMDPIPEPGQHTDQILRSLGYTSAEIERLRQENAV
jgi:crotonobetainyl-CoA:carnitine CoA-transferase CaiB-like acyl-CoA transferase